MSAELSAAKITKPKIGIIKRQFVICVNPIVTVQHLKLIKQPSASLLLELDKYTFN